MSATPNNAAPGWGNAPSPSTAAQEARDADGHNALQGLLAFACIHQQAARREARSFLSRVFDGALVPAVATFLKETDLSPADVQQLKAILEKEGKR